MSVANQSLLKSVVLDQGSLLITIQTSHEAVALRVVAVVASPAELEVKAISQRTIVEASRSAVVSLATLLQEVEARHKPLESSMQLPMLY